MAHAFDKYGSASLSQTAIGKQFHLEMEKAPRQLSCYVKEINSRFGEICDLYLDGISLDDMPYLKPEDLIDLVPKRHTKHRCHMLVLVRRYLFPNNDNFGFSRFRMNTFQQMNNIAPMNGMGVPEEYGCNHEHPQSQEMDAESVMSMETGCATSCSGSSKSHDDMNNQHKRHRHGHKHHKSKHSVCREEGKSCDTSKV
jgi:hypothetical protein